MSINWKLFGAALVLATPLAVTPALSAGDGGTDTSTQCTGGKVWDEDKQECVDPQESNLDNVYDTGRALALEGRYGEAILVLSSVADSGDPRVLNYLGYSHRMQGRVTVGLGYYQEALRIDPGHTLVREYMGEAYLQLGQVDKAREQLAEIEKRCGTGCAEFAELDARIAEHLKKG